MGTQQTSHETGLGLRGSWETRPFVWQVRDPSLFRGDTPLSSDSTNLFMSCLPWGSLVQLPFKVGLDWQIGVPGVVSQ